MMMIAKVIETWW